jgi:hypothetical protein
MAFKLLFEPGLSAPHQNPPRSPWSASSASVSPSAVGRSSARSAHACATTAASPRHLSAPVDGRSPEPFAPLRTRMGRHDAGAGAGSRPVRRNQMTIAME